MQGLKWIPGFENRYGVTCFGHVWSFVPWRGRSGPRLLTQHLSGSGYFFVTLGRGRQRYVHRLVLETWGSPAPSVAHQANHKNGDKLDNHVTNLEWVSPAENTEHAYQLGLSTRGSARYNAKLTEDVVSRLKARSRANPGLSHQKLAEEFGVSRRRVSRILCGEIWRHVP